MVECSDGLIEIQNMLKKEVGDEWMGHIRYKDISTELGALGETDYSGIITLLSQAEQMHKMVVEGLVDAIDLRCGQPVSSRGKESFKECVSRKLSGSTFKNIAESREAFSQAAKECGGKEGK